MTRKNSSPALRPKWLVLIVVLLVAYGLLQPVVNSRLGWELPSLTSLLGEQTQRSKPVVNEYDKPLAGRVVTTESDGDSTSSPQNSSRKQTERASTSTSLSSEALNATGDKSEAADLLYGLLRETRPDEYVSPAGLRYTRGSEEGHRLDHLARHLQDQPDRPGRHGVFQGDMPQLLLWLDEAYSRANKRAKGTKTRDEEGRTIIEVTFEKPIGYIGGRDGDRQGHPESKRLRMVLDGNRVITAFPY